MTQVRRWLFAGGRILISGSLAAAGALALAQQPGMVSPWPPPTPPQAPAAPWPPLAPLPPMPATDAWAAIPALPSDLADLPFLAFQDSPRDAAREEARRAREIARNA